MKTIICAVLIIVAASCHRRQQLAEDAYNLDKKCIEWFSWCAEHYNQACADRVIAYCSEERDWIHEQMQADREEQQEREARGDTFLQRLGRGLRAAGCSVSGNCVQIVNDPVHCTTKTFGSSTETYCR
jgi:hypothetical protein